MAPKSCAHWPTGYKTWFSAQVRVVAPAEVQPCNHATMQPCNHATMQPCNMQPAAKFGKMHLNCGVIFDNCLDKTEVATEPVATGYKSLRKVRTVCSPGSRRDSKRAPVIPMQTFGSHCFMKLKMIPTFVCFCCPFNTDVVYPMFQEGPFNKSRRCSDVLGFGMTPMSPT